VIFAKMLSSELNQQEATIGLVSKNDGWCISEALWQRMAPLLPPQKPHPLRVPEPAHSRGLPPGSFSPLRVEHFTPVVCAAESRY
jgi:hypothetical protein